MKIMESLKRAADELLSVQGNDDALHNYLVKPMQMAAALAPVTGIGRAPVVFGILAVANVASDVARRASRLRQQANNHSSNTPG